MSSLQQRNPGEGRYYPFLDYGWMANEAENVKLNAEKLQYLTQDVKIQIVEFVT